MKLRPGARAFTLVALGLGFGLGACDNGTSSEPVDSGTYGDGGSDGSALDSSMPDTGADTSTPDTGTGGDAGADDSSSGPMGCQDGGTSQCGAPTACGPVVMITQSMASPPMQMGGSITPGTYVLTAATEYGSQSFYGTTWQFTLGLTATDFALMRYIQGQQVPAAAGTYTTSTSSFNESQTCPSTGTAMLQYSATSTTFTLAYVPMGQTYTIVQQYTRQ